MQPSCRNAGPLEILRAAGLRRTRARVAVLVALTSARRPMTQQQVATVSALKTSDRVTIYRTLAALVASGLLHVVRGVDGTARYCANQSGPGCPGGHLHFQCSQCGEMRCVHSQRLPRISAGAGFVVKAKQMVAFGLCSRCARARDRRSAPRQRRRTERS